MGFVMQPFTVRKQGLHDLMTGCIVVARPRGGGPPDSQKAT
jgi:hypothetical protein